MTLKVSVLKVIHLQSLTMHYYCYTIRNRCCWSIVRNYCFSFGDLDCCHLSHHILCLVLQEALQQQPRCLYVFSSYVKNIMWLVYTYSWQIQCRETVGKVAFSF